MNRFSRTNAVAPRPIRRGGFTLIESALCTVIVGVGVVAMIQLMAAGTMSNSEGTELTTAINLANNVREISLGLPFADPQAPTTWATKESTVAAYDDVLDLDDCTFSPPLDVRRQPISAYSNWSQVVTVQSVAQDNLTSVRPDTMAEATARVTCVIKHNNDEVYQLSWLVVAPNPAQN